eukprot:scaffold162748_cov51-Prasinocladus_malaysianus.AAC.2
MSCTSRELIMHGLCSAVWSLLCFLGVKTGDLLTLYCAADQISTLAQALGTNDQNLAQHLERSPPANRCRDYISPNSVHEITFPDDIYCVESTMMQTKASRSKNAPVEDN